MNVDFTEDEVAFILNALMWDVESSEYYEDDDYDIEMYNRVMAKFHDVKENV